MARNLLAAGLVVAALGVSAISIKVSTRPGTDDLASEHVASTHPEAAPARRGEPSSDDVSLGLFIQAAAGAAVFLYAVTRHRRSDSGK